MNHTTKDTLKHTLKFLNRILENGPVNADEGLCLQYRMFRNPSDQAIYPSDIGMTIASIVVDWAEERGLNLKCPIEGSMLLYNQNTDKWNKDTQYGEMRWNLVEYVKVRVEQELEILK